MRRMSAVLGMALASVGLVSNPLQPVLQPSPPSKIEAPYIKTKKKNNFPSGNGGKKKRQSKYIPAGSKKNVQGVFVKNDKQAIHMNKIYKSWHETKFDTPAVGFGLRGG